MKANVILRKSFAKRRLAGDTEIPAEVELSNGKKLRLYFILDKGIIEVTHDGKNCEKQKLTAEERCAIIEAVLIKYTSLVNSCLNLTIAYYIEVFKLADSTTISGEYDLENIISKKIILEEYVGSKYSKNSTSAALRALNKVYDFYIKNKSKIGKEELVVSLDEDISYVQKLDLKYYSNVLFDSADIEISTYCKQQFFIFKSKN